MQSEKLISVKNQKRSNVTTLKYNAKLKMSEVKKQHTVLKLQEGNKDGYETPLT